MLELPWPPSVNRYWRSIPLRRGYRVVLSREGRAYRTDVCARLAAPRRLLVGRLHVRVTPSAVLGAALHIAVRHRVPVDWCGSRQAACAFTEACLRMAIREGAVSPVHPGGTSHA